MGLKTFTANMFHVAVTARKQSPKHSDAVDPLDIAKILIRHDVDSIHCD